MLFLLSLGDVVHPAASGQRKATVAVRIVAGGRASQIAWDETPPSRRKDILIDDPSGRIVRVRLIEFE